jgi:hypothetical protein
MSNQSISRTYSYIVPPINIFLVSNNMFKFWMVLGLWCLTPLSTLFQLYRGLNSGDIK